MTDREMNVNLKLSPVLVYLTLHLHGLFFIFKINAFHSKEIMAAYRQHRQTELSSLNITIYICHTPTLLFTLC